MKKYSFVLSGVETERMLSGGLLRSLAAGILVLSVVFNLYALLAFRELMGRALVFGGSVLFVCVFVFWLIRREKLQFAGFVLVAFLWVMVSFGSYTAGGVDAPIFIGYAAVIVLGALALGMKAGVLIIFFTIGFGGFLIHADTNQFLPARLYYPPAARLFIYIFFFFVIVLLQK